MTTPTTDLPKRIVDARAAWVDANIEAERIEGVARRARRRANARLHHYERLLREHQGQERLPFPKEE